MGRPAGSGVTEPIVRFMAKVNVLESGCWEWTGARHPSGYGKFFTHKEAGRTILAYAHRWSYEYHVGPIPDGHQIDHLCRNRWCVNPAHLEPVLPVENIGRIPTQHRGRNGMEKRDRCARGHEYTPENTARYPSRYGRVCKTCQYGGREAS